MGDLDFSGQTLDGKYQIERELGRGGMGTVYLANHLGTERPVAIKIISPQFMQRTEFVERFRREARAAGRLRHPNVVNVTDFGFADTSSGQVAYLVMEYLDGCTLGEILDEEKNLPVGWTLDILEQVCSAVHEAHQQGIIHRDLKPDNIWLEPNQRGGYTVKVLDFGIAKLEEHDTSAADGQVPPEFLRSVHTQFGGAKHTFAGAASDGTLVEGVASTYVGDGPTVASTGEQKTLAAEANTVLLSPVADEGATAILETDPCQSEVDPGRSSAGNGAPASSSTSARSLYDSRSSAELTRVGAVLGTPLYMSPEQCRGEHLDPRSDIYSLAVIAYQMLSGKPPFEGDFKAVMEAHKTTPPAPLKAKKVRRKLRRAILSALDKDPENRPETAEAFASVLRSRSEGIFGIVRRGLMIYSEHLPKFLTLTSFLFIVPTILTILVVGLSFLKVSEAISDSTANISIGVLGIGLTLANAFFGSLIIGTISMIVTQSIAIPLRPVRLRPVLYEAGKKWKRFAGAGALNALMPILFGALGAILGFIAFAAIGGLLYPVTGSVGAIFITGAIGASLVTFVAFFGSYVAFMLVPPVVMMEKLSIRETFKRSTRLVKRSVATSAAAALLIFLIPAVVAGSISFVVNITARALDPKKAAEQTEITNTAEVAAETAVTEEPGPPPSGNWRLSIGGQKISQGREKDMRERVKETVLGSMIQILWLPMQIFVFSFSGIIVALLYHKTRLAGGESMNDLIERFEDDGRPRKKWQERVRARLIQSGRVSSNPSK